MSKISKNIKSKTWSNYEILQTSSHFSPRLFSTHFTWNFGSFYYELISTNPNKMIIKAFPFVYSKCFLYLKRDTAVLSFKVLRTPNRLYQKWEMFAFWGLVSFNFEFTIFIHACTWLAEICSKITKMQKNWIKIESWR